MVYGKTGGEFPIALLCIIPKEIAKIAEAKGVSGTMEEMCANKAVIDEVAKECRDKCKSKEGGRLVEFEIPKKYVLLPPVSPGVSAWTPENEMLTNTMKLKRPQIVRAFK